MTPKCQFVFPFFLSPANDERSKTRSISVADSAEVMSQKAQKPSNLHSLRCGFSTLPHFIRV